MARKTSYQFTAVPTQLFLCMDNNCRSTLFSLIQLSSVFESKNGAAFDGWFYRSNALLQEETNLSKNVLSGTLDSLYQAGIVDIRPQEKGRGKAQGSRMYKVNYESFLKYQSLPIEDCSCSHPVYGIVTSDYKKGAPSFQLQPQLKCRKSDNHIDNTDNTESIDIIETDNISNIDNSIINNNLDISCHFEEVCNEQVEGGTDKEEPVPSSDGGDDAMDGFDFNSSREIEMGSSIGLQASGELDKSPQRPSITAEFIESQIPFVYSRVRRLGAHEPDNYTEPANSILDEYSNEVTNWVACAKSDSIYSMDAMSRLVEVINGREYRSQAECEKTALDLVDYVAKVEAQYGKELRSKIYN